jgi:Flp pilus assembly CpaF family ATPase
MNATRVDGHDQRITTVVRDLRRRLAETLPGPLAAEDPARTEAAILELLQSQASTDLAAGRTPLGRAEEDQVLVTLLDDVRGIGPIGLYLRQPGLENLDINGCDNVWATYTGGDKRRQPPVCASDDELRVLQQRIVATYGGDRHLDYASTFAVVQIGRARVSLKDHTSHRPLISVRQPPPDKVAPTDLIRAGTLSPHLAAFLGAAVAARLNLVVAAGMDGGKTTLLRALAGQIPVTERVITLESDRELYLHDDPERDVASLQGRQDNTEGHGSEELAVQLEQGLRLNGRRVIVGETRGRETAPMLRAMNIGSDGSMCTVHASSARDAYNALIYLLMSHEAMSAEAAAFMVARAVDLVVSMGKEPDTGGRYVHEVIATTPNPIPGTLLVSADDVYRRDPVTGRAHPAGLPDHLRLRLAEVGYTTAHWDTTPTDYWPLNPAALWSHDR